MRRTKMTGQAQLTSVTSGKFKRKRNKRKTQCSPERGKCRNCGEGLVIETCAFHCIVFVLKKNCAVLVLKMPYGNVHRRFLQSFVYHPVQNVDEAIQTYRLVCQEQEEEESSLDAVIQTINDCIRKHTNLEIKTSLCELTGEKYYVAANTGNFSWTKSTSLYNKGEQIMFKKIVDDIVRSDDGSTSSIACLNHSGQSSMTKTDAAKSITHFVSDGWFSEKEGCLYMGVRGVAELEPFISEAYEDLKSNCPLCKTLIFWGHQCSSCSETSHIHCLRKFFASGSSRTVCPSCEAEWMDWDTEYDD